MYMYYMLGSMVRRVSGSTNQRRGKIKFPASSDPPVLPLDPLFATTQPPIPDFEAKSASMPGEDGRSRKGRVTLACKRCRRRKIKCSLEGEETRCRSCIRAGEDCEFTRQSEHQREQAPLENEKPFCWRPLQRITGPSELSTPAPILPAPLSPKVCLPPPKSTFSRACLSLEAYRIGPSQPPSSSEEKKGLPPVALGTSWPAHSHPPAEGQIDGQQVGVAKPEAM